MFSRIVIAFISAAAIANAKPARIRRQKLAPGVLPPMLKHDFRELQVPPIATLESMAYGLSMPYDLSMPGLSMPGLSMPLGFSMLTVGLSMPLVDVEEHADEILSTTADPVIVPDVFSQTPDQSTTTVAVSTTKTAFTSSGGSANAPTETTDEEAPPAASITAASTSTNPNTSKFDIILGVGIGACVVAGAVAIVAVRKRSQALEAASQMSSSASLV